MRKNCLLVIHERCNVRREKCNLEFGEVVKRVAKCDMLLTSVEERTSGVCRHCDAAAPPTRRDPSNNKPSRM